MSTPTTLFHVHQDTEHFSWDAYGASAEEAARAFVKGWRDHRRQTSAMTFADYWGMTEAEVIANPDLLGCSEVRVGHCYRDHTDTADFR